MNSSEKTVILVDDHQLLRDALANLINSFDEFKVIRTTSNGLDLIEVMEQGIQPDLILLDLNMPKMDGFEVAKWLFKNRPQIPVLILTMYDSEIALIRLLQSGVRGFLKKDVHPSELRAALNAVGQGGYYYSHNTTGKLASLFQHDSGSSQAIEKATFSDKELEFLRLVSTDLTYKEIAAALKMTPRAIDGYRDTLFEKLDVKSRVGLAIYAVKNGIVSI